MSNAKQSNELIEQLATTERSFIRFTLGQRWEHVIVIISFTILLFTGLPQKYRTTTWSQTILSTPERVEMIRQIHHIAAVVLIAEVIYHLGFALYLLFKRKLSGEMFPTWQDFKDAWQMINIFYFFLNENQLSENITLSRSLLTGLYSLGSGLWSLLD